MSLDTHSSSTDFTSLANPHFDMKSVGSSKTHPHRMADQQTTPVSLSSIPLREMLVIQPPLAKSERLPRTLRLAPQEFSVTFSPDPAYIRVQKLGFFIPERHELMVDLVMAELADPDYRTTHGTALTYRQGCNGPLCRRARRDAANETKELRLVRMGLRAQLSTRSARYFKLKQTVPHYAAIEPLLFCYTVYTHQVNPPVSPTAESTIYSALNTPLKMHEYIKLTYRPDVQPAPHPTSGVSGTPIKTP